MIHIPTEKLADFEKNIRREWTMTNGIGGYAGGSIIGACNRTHQGYLIASLHPPVERYLVFSKTNEKLTQGTHVYNLETSQHAGKGHSPIRTQGQRFLTDFSCDGTVCFSYSAGNIRMDKHLALLRESNTVAISYTITNQGEEAGLSITPLMNFREHSASSAVSDLQFTCEPNTVGGFTLIPAAAPGLCIELSCSAGRLFPRENQYDVDMQYQTEVDNETAGLDTHFCPYDLRFTLPAHSSTEISLLCTVHPVQDTPVLSRPQADTAAIEIAHVQEYYDSLKQQAGYGDDAFANTLVVAADQFLARRDSTGLMTILAGLPWFTDWGRDTMIAFSGLTLATRRFSDAREILSTFAQYVHHGTDFSIYMDDDALIHAGSGLDQVTWMDVRVGDWVATPRHGKPVEINALWYNALCVTAELAEHFKEDSSVYRQLATRVSASFRKEFWNEKDGCLYDVIEENGKDASIRPNQIYAVSLPHTMLTAKQALQVVNTVEEKLLAGPGIRSLSPEHKDYHEIYCGSLPKRDAAYHQGTAWGFLMGGFLTAYMKVHHHSPEAKKQAMAYLAPVQTHLLEEGCIGSISEIFDGDAPHTCRGCYAQAWSVGEILRCYTQDIQKNQK